MCQFLFQRSYLEFFFRVKCTWTASKPSGLIVLLLYRAMNTLRSSLICEMQSKSNRVKPCKTCRILFLFLYSHVQWLCTICIREWNLAWYLSTFDYSSSFISIVLYMPRSPGTCCFTGVFDQNTGHSIIKRWAPFRFILRFQKAKSGGHLIRCSYNIIYWNCGTI